MNTAAKVERLLHRIELMIDEAELLCQDCETIVQEAKRYHAENFSDFDILDREAYLGDRAATDRIGSAQSFRSSASQIRTTLKSELRNMLCITRF